MGWQEDKDKRETIDKGRHRKYADVQNWLLLRSPKEKIIDTLVDAVKLFGV